MRRSILILFMLLLMCSGAVLADHHEANAGVAAVPVGGDGPGIALPGGAYEFAFHAHDGDYLSFATMLAQSNDGFLRPMNMASPSMTWARRSAAMSLTRSTTGTSARSATSRLAKACTRRRVKPRPIPDPPAMAWCALPAISTTT